MSQHVQWSLQRSQAERGSPRELRSHSQRLLAYLLQEFRHDSLAQYHIDSRGRRGRPRRPIAFVKSHASEEHSREWSLVHQRLSISHISRAVSAAVSNHRVGIDIVDGQLKLSDGFARTWFDERERVTIGDLPIAAFWAAKEAAYKAHCRCDTFSPHQWKIVTVTNDSRFEPDVINCRVAKHRDSNPSRWAYVRIIRRAEFVIALATATANPVLEEKLIPSSFSTSLIESAS
ncbi:4'-phosphopantetheinyl transferase superfamily protein [Allorhodopirellula heiligendammensis]|uniref:4'-phosphopantetheinyl transferase superfamily protein n=1 Tax=Allorhodopirellula heiligendammensis TaxID=2714739 RepID=A0A5C6C5C9_9BACT|nr:4'-phosphopantetheinyl transferase superfamily protein [Allorhodopirellula heiligendammensis]TWU18666.1 4'-phosphopantetheinyl transferase superfamily protein [Allorhodopirellula heiligendammensis]